MNNKATGVINEAHFEEPSFSAPYTEGTDGVREGNPKWNKQHPGVEVHSPEQRPCDENQRDGGKDDLKVYHSGIGKVPRKSFAQKELAV